VDIEPQSFNLNPELIRRKITTKTRAILPVHLFGQLARMEAINEIAREHGSRYRRRRAGHRRQTSQQARLRVGLAGCLSFYPTKNLGAFGDAGAICTNDDSFAEPAAPARARLRPYLST
jgi:dTDP-4-amino-4,6-dideoxygalactose transaminase